MFHRVGLKSIVNHTGGRGTGCNFTKNEFGIEHRGCPARTMGISALDDRLIATRKFDR